MEKEQRGRPVQLDDENQPRCGRSFHPTTKPYTISKHLIVEAYKRVKANKGSAGVDGQSLKDFEADLQNNLYNLNPASNNATSYRKTDQSIIEH